MYTNLSSGVRRANEQKTNQIRKQKIKRWGVGKPDVHGQKLRLTAASQNACRRRNTGTSAVPQHVSGNLLDDIRHYNARSKTAAVRAAGK